jgi:DHA2 family multidrug resistance protein
MLRRTITRDFDYDHGLARPTINPWFIAATVTIAAFMELLDTSIANGGIAVHRWRIGA